MQLTIVLRLPGASGHEDYFRLLGCPMCDQHHNLEKRLETLLCELRPEDMTGETAESYCKFFAKLERMAAAGKVLCAKRVADTGRYKMSGSRSGASWLADKTGDSMGGAIRSLEAAEQAAQLPALDEAMRSGRLSATQAAEVAEATKADPSKGSELIEQAATASLRDLKRRCEQVKSAARTEADAKKAYAAIHARRYLRSWTEHDGAVRLDALLAPLDGARVLSAIASESQYHFNLARAQGRRERAAVYAADALVSLLSSSTVESESGDDPRSQAETATAAESAGLWPSNDGCASTRDLQQRLLPDTSDGGPSDRQGPVPDDSEGASPNDRQAPVPEAPGADAGRNPATIVSRDPRPSPGAGEAPSPTTSRRSENGRSPAAAPSGRPAGPPDGTPAETPVSGRTGRRRRGGGERPTYTVHLRVDLAALQRGELASGEICEIPGVGPVPLSTAIEVLGDALVHAIIGNGVDVQTVSNLGRTVPAAAKVALVERDPVCVVPGCDQALNLEIDHWKEPFWKCRSTGLAGLCRICKFHHHLKTYKGFVLKGGPGNWIWLTPDEQRSSAPGA